MRKFITKEVSFTDISFATMEIIAGQPKAITQPIRTELGKISKDKAQKLIHDEIGTHATVFKAEIRNVVYQMEITEFIKHAQVKGKDTPIEDEESSSFYNEETAQ